MATELDAIEQAILNGDFDAIDRLAADEFEDEEPGEGETKKGEAESDDGGAAEDDTNDGKGTDTGADSQEENKPEADKPEEQEAGGSPSQEEPQRDQLDTSQISFDEDGNAIIPKDLLSVISKDGKHQIPYGVLESERQRARETKALLDSQTKEYSDLKGKQGFSSRKAEALAKQLSDAGIDPAKLPEEIELTDELLKSLDDYGEVGEVIKALVARTGSKAAQEEKPTKEDATAQQPEANPRQAEYADYLKNNKAFADIMEDDSSDEFATVDLFFKQVTKSPEFKDKPLAAQLDEAMARTRKAFGQEEAAPAQKDPEPKQPTQAEQDAISAKAQEALKAAQEQSTPASPSEVGAGGDSQKKTIDRAREANGSDLLDVVGELSAAELEKLFDELD